MVADVVSGINGGESGENTIATNRSSWLITSGGGGARRTGEIKKWVCKLRYH